MLYRQTLAFAAASSDFFSVYLTDRQPALHDQSDASSLPNASQSIGINSLSIGPFSNCLAAKPYHRLVPCLDSRCFHAPSKQ